MDLRATATKIAKEIRMSVIKRLIVQDFAKCNALKDIDEEKTAFMATEIYKIKVPTILLKDLFQDVHEYRREIGQFDGPVNVKDLEFCGKSRRHAGVQGFTLPRWWLPRKTDSELWAIPEIKDYDKLCRENGNKLLIPYTAKEQTRTAEDVVKLLVNNLRRN